MSTENGTKNKTCNGCYVVNGNGHPRNPHTAECYCGFGFKVTYDTEKQKLMHTADCPHPRSWKKAKEYVTRRMRGKQ